MARLEDLTIGTPVKGVVPGATAVPRLWNPPRKWDELRGLLENNEQMFGAHGHRRRLVLFLEVKGRAIGAETLTVTRNEIMTALNKPGDFILAIATVDPLTGGTDGAVANLRYAREPFQREPDFAVTSVNDNLEHLLERGAVPA